MVDEDDDQQQQEGGEEKERAKDEVPPTAEGSSSAAVGTVDATAAGSTGGAPSNSGSAGCGEIEGVGENDGDHDGCSGTAAADEGDGDRLPPGKVRLLEYRAPPSGTGGERGETRYASLGDDVSKFITFLESPVARGIREGDPDELDVAVGAGVGAAEESAAAGTERRIFASTVEIGEEELQQSLKELWREGRLLSQGRDAANVLRGQEVCVRGVRSARLVVDEEGHWCLRGLSCVLERLLGSFFNLLPGRASVKCLGACLPPSTTKRKPSRVVGASHSLSQCLPSLALPVRRPLLPPSPAKLLRAPRLVHEQNKVESLGGNPS